MYLMHNFQRDGGSLRTLIKNVENFSSIFMIIQTFDGNVFGCFTSSPWGLERDFFGSGHSFVWRLRHKRSISNRAGYNDAEKEEKLQVFPCSNLDVSFKFVPDDILAVGKCCDCSKDICISSFSKTGGTEQLGFAILLHDDLQRGETFPSTTLHTPRLIDSVDGAFEVFNLEVYGFANMPSLEEARVENLNSTSDLPVEGEFLMI
jgi:hypothetical protein